MKLDRKSVAVLYNGINEILSSDNEYDYKFNYALIKTKKEIKSEFDETIEMLKSIQQKKNNIKINYCDKDENNNPISKQIKPGVYQYAGLENNNEFIEKYNELIKQENEYLSEEIEFKSWKIPADSMPNKLKGSFQETINDLIDG